MYPYEEYDVDGDDLSIIIRCFFGYIIIAGVCTNKRIKLI